MNIGIWLKKAESKLKDSGIESAYLDSLILLEDAIKLDRSTIIAHPETSIPNQKLEKLNYKLKIRSEHTPLAYIRKTIEFYGYNFIVNPNVLIPRPESEAFLSLLAQHKPKNNEKLLDIGTGSGALAICAKLYFPDLQVFASDTSKTALSTALLNIRYFDVPIDLFLEDLTNDKNMYDYIFANLPYVPYGFPVSQEVEAEPASAIFADDGGLELINKLAPESRIWL